MKIDDAIKDLASCLIERGLTLSIAEGMTGGLFGHLLTSQPGASRYYLGSIITYSVASRDSVLHIPVEITNRHGTVSEKSTAAMAERTRSYFESDVGIGLSGIAGPSGGSITKPVGLVWVSVSHRTISRAVKFQIRPSRSRQGIQREACKRAAIFAVETILSTI